MTATESVKTMSLIANTSIQMVSIPVEIDLNDTESTLLFHEWFDYDDNEEKLELAYCLRKAKRYYKRSEMESYNLVERETGELLVSEVEAMECHNLISLGEGELSQQQELFNMNGGSRLCMIDSLIDQWLPMPFYENVDWAKGPYNWCRAKLIPVERIDKDEEKIIRAKLLLAFDTHAEYRPFTDYDQCPVFQVASELEKTYACPSMPSMLIDYCSGDNSWVRTGLMRIVHGTENIEDVRTDITKGQQKYAYLATYIWLIHYIQKNADLPRICLKRDRDIAGIDVDMVIDIGNSRTAAILYEGDFSDVVPLSLQNWTHPLTSIGSLNRVQESFDMRVAFQNVEFGDYIQSSQQFLWPSIVRLGDEAQELTFQTSLLAEGDEHFSTYSSPKRYLWDTLKREKEWRQVRTSIDGRNETPSLPGVTGYFDDDGTLDPEGLSSGFHYSRRTLMTLAFMEIVAQARVQINGYDYRIYRGNPSKPRHLRKIILTCPTGMSKKEQKALHDCLHDALFVLDKFYGNNDPDYKVQPVSIVPEIGVGAGQQWMYDEATCSQFVYLYGLLTETYQNCSEELFNVYGRVRDGKKSLVVGSLDIGAGTSDVMIAHYDAPSSSLSARLKPVPIFWDSFDIAGDDMLRDLIANVLIQGTNGQLEQVLKSTERWTEDEVRGKLFYFFGRNQIDFSFMQKLLRRDFNLQVLVPIMYEFLRLHSLGETSRDISYTDLFKDKQPSKVVRDRFKEVFDIDLEDIVWHFDRDVLSHYIVASLDKDLIEKVANIMYSYGCDVVLLSGRPTSLKPIEEAFLSHVPSLAGRLVVMNNYEIGDWYPFIDKSRRRINNSKSIVPIGAIIGYLASIGGGLNEFSVDMSELSTRLKPTTDYFVINNATVNENPSFLKPSSRTGSFEMKSSPIYIGAKQFDIGLYPVRPFYVLSIDGGRVAERLRNDDPNLTDSDIKIETERELNRIKREIPIKVTLARDDFKDDKETLTIESVEGASGDDLPIRDFSLSLQSLNDPDCYWMDSGIFEINRGVGRQ